ncbi:MAG: excinuclease ABC subunit C [Desulfobacterales bacterium RIFOXYA12_FULL_46_15]|nr:MAG: excinuclease ABC subunit C [Desulfobacula sp. GWF2_41_7]OGR23369.1 MAG: excinuclease ABC subunit C [Desulfobacterales bacterium RIFOXYA12_FULL_46_15]
MIPDPVLEKYRQTPHAPGVYLMKDAGGKTIYVGKAKDLKKRLSSYFIKKDHHDGKTLALLEMIRDFEVIITSSGHEAFILESNLIKEYDPKYNVILKDGKNYPLLRIDMNDDYPSIMRVRTIKKDNALYFGPYSSSLSVNRTLTQIQRLFRLRKCKNTQFKNRSRPCLNYQIKACLGLCCNKVSSEEYKRQVQDAILFLKGRSKEVIDILKARMTAYAESQEYEKAAQVRDTLSAVSRIMEKQVVVSPDMKDRDIIAFASDRGSMVITVMMVRSGYLIDTAHYPFDLGFKEPEEMLPAFLHDYYENLGLLPSSILLSREIENRAFFEDRLSEKKQGRVSIHVPARGEKKRLVDMAGINASQELEKRLLREDEERAAVFMLKDLLSMDRLPERIECFDNSNLSGQDPVSAMVVFKDGRPYKEGYRKFIIRDMDTPDDYAAMFKVLSRRFSKEPSKMQFPDLLLVDGGKGQLGMALAVLKDLEIEDRFMTAGLAKKDEAKGEAYDKIYIPGRSNPLNTSNAVKALYLLQRVRDEAHRFAITFQRNRREKRAGLSFLDDIPGIGPKKKKALLMHFKGLSAIKAASVEEIAALPGMTQRLAEKLVQALQDITELNI